MNNKVEPVKECMLCYELHTVKNIADLKCWSEEDDHIICKDCFMKESERRKSLGIQSPNECIICKPFQEKIETFTISPSRNITITIENTSDNNETTRCESCKKSLICIVFLLVFYAGLILNWHLYRVINHFIETGNNLDKPIDWNILNAFYALIFLQLNAMGLS